ncbi:hypothetical protein A6M21_05750 [Desulfotomaculum copahuensis]|uniref:Uncharacterized protein n=1 Tax=Desulfotomaculum copahuensis TaxID=1838280 RepID=A0A1B7LGU6_9FIRM|nr:hypothetical protein A6M21_05750 [Desulfotomaculum copahuensis]
MPRGTVPALTVKSRIQAGGLQRAAALSRPRRAGNCPGRILLRPPRPDLAPPGRGRLFHGTTAGRLFAPTRFCG